MKTLTEFKKMDPSGTKNGKGNSRSVSTERKKVIESGIKTLRERVKGEERCEK